MTTVLSAASPDDFKRPSKSRKRHRTKQLIQATREAHATIDDFREAMVSGQCEFAGRIIQDVLNRTDEILRSVIDQLPPGTSPVACERLVVGTAKLFADSLDRNLLDYEDLIVREIKAAEAEIVERAMRQLQLAAKRMDVRLYEDDAIVVIRRGARTLRLTRNTAETRMILLLLGSESLSASFQEIAEKVFGVKELTRSVIERIRTRKCSLVKKLVATFGHPPTNDLQGHPVGNHGWIISTGDQAYRVNKEVLTWKCQSEGSAPRIRACRNDDGGRLLVDPKTIPPKKSDQSAPEKADDLERDRDASDTDDTHHSAARHSITSPRTGVLLPGKVGAGEEALTLKPSVSPIVRLSAPSSAGLRNHLAKRRAASPAPGDTPSAPASL